MSMKAFLNGMAWGFVIGILVAPTSGDETRKKIAKKAADIRDTLKDKYNSVRDKIDEIKGRGEEALVNGKAEASNIFE